MGRGVTRVYRWIKRVFGLRPTFGRQVREIRTVYPLRGLAQRESRIQREGKHRREI